MTLSLKLNISIVNALWTILVGEQLELTDPKIVDLISLFDKFVRSGTRPSVFLMSLSSTLVKLVDPTFKRASTLFNEIKKLILPFIDDHMETVDHDSPRDYMDIYLTNILNTTDPNSSFYGKRGKESLIASILDLFLAGSETIWGFEN